MPRVPVSLCAPRSVFQAGPGHEAGRGLASRAGSRESRSRSSGAGWVLLGGLGRSLPRAGCEAGVTSRSRGGQEGRSARARLVGRGSERGTGARARAFPGGRVCLCGCTCWSGPLQAAEAAAAPDTCGGDPPAARRCGPWWRRCCWAPAAAAQLNYCLVKSSL